MLQPLQPLLTGAVVGSFGPWFGDRLIRRRSRRQMASGRLSGADLPTAD